MVDLIEANNLDHLSTGIWNIAIVLLMHFFHTMASEKQQACCIPITTTERKSLDKLYTIFISLQYIAVEAVYFLETMFYDHKFVIVVQSMCSVKSRASIEYIKRAHSHIPLTHQIQCLTSLDTLSSCLLNWTTVPTACL